MSAVTQMITRVRNSSRCSTSDRRSSCAMGFSRVAMALRRGGAMLRRINELLNSGLIEEKQYTAY